jgi:hypothetical protein
MQNPTKKSIWGKTLASAFVMSALVLGSASGVLAAYNTCQRRLARADRRVHEAARRHGWESKEAQHARVQLREAREYCWGHSHRWWDEDAHRWHTERDWDEHDHDRR